ncbi:MAG: 50S ribosomal protein L10 [Clostridiales bacterium]|nr:50S ribosomal protein L10 [Clostridiales bacterium]
MPSAKVLEQKKEEVAKLAARFDGACAGVLVDYKGINVADDTKLRSDLRNAGVEYTVTKNTMIELAIKDSPLADLTSALAGTTAVATSNDDYVAAAKILCKFADTHKGFTVKSGFIDASVIDAAKVISLSKLPSREVLLATVCSVFNAPIASFARAVQAIVDKSGEAVEAAPVEEAAAPVEEAAAPVEEAAAPVEEAAAPVEEAAAPVEAAAPAEEAAE